MQNNINEIVAKALAVDKNVLKNKLKLILKTIKEEIKVNKKAILYANEIDIEKNNGFIIDFNIIDNIFSIIEKENIMYGDVTLSQKDEEVGIIFGTQIMDCGNIVVINDGNSYVIIEMILRNILAGNTTIFTNSGYMFGTNQLLIQIVQNVLEQFNVSKNLIQIFITEDYHEVLSNYANIDLVICIGDHNLQGMILNKSKSKTIVSGYENFEIYIEDISHIEFLNKIINTGLSIKTYVNKDVELEYDDSILVDDIDEAIALINYNGASYSSSIFTTSTENASKFINEVKSKIVTVNTSPTIERIIDIKQIDLVNEKKIIYPLGFKFSDSIQIETK